MFTLEYHDKVGYIFLQNCALIVDNNTIIVATSVTIAIVFKCYKKHSRQVLSLISVTSANIWQIISIKRSTVVVNIP
jgi:hypothetical protein